MMNRILQLPLSAIKAGYLYNPEAEKYICHICGRVFETSEVFPVEGRFFNASRAVQFHVREDHGEMLDLLVSNDKKYTGITENQKDLLKMIGDGLSDSEIAKKAGLSPATVRHQRFVFREKAKQAKLYLAIFELVEEAARDRKGKNTNDDLIDIHSGAKMVDDRYSITKSEEEKILATVFESLQPLKLKVFSPKEKKKIVILRKICSQFDKGVKYSEKEVNAVLKPIYNDYATIRRYLVEYGFMERTKDCREYWLK